MFVPPLQTCKHDILKTNEPILLEMCTGGPRGKMIQKERSAFRIRRSKVKVTQRQS